MTTPEPPRQARADAVRNRERIMEAARQQITENGPDVGMNVIAAAAGVAVGTLYRNFPSKAELINAVVQEHAEGIVADLEATAERVGQGAPVLPELRGVSERYLDSAARNHAVKAAAQALGADYGPTETRAYAAMGRLITMGRERGVLRADVTLDDFILLVATAPTHLPAAARGRWLTIYLDGLVNTDRIQ